MIILQSIKLILNTYCDISSSSYLWAFFLINSAIVYGLANYQIYYYTRIVPCPMAVNITIAAFIIGLCLGQIGGSLIIYYMDTVYDPPLETFENNLNNNSIMEQKLRNESSALYEEEEFQKNSIKTILQNCIIIFVIASFFF